jgi:hypothetical protein
VLSDCNPSNPQYSTAIESYLQLFNHTDTNSHDEEIDDGADEVLYRVLLALVTDGSGQLPADGFHAGFSTRRRQKICNVCKIIELVYQCSKEKVELSFQRVGHDFMNLLCVVLSTELQRHSIHPDEAPSNSRPLPDVPRSSTTRTRRVPLDGTIKAVTKIISSYARVQSATPLIAQHNRLITLLGCIIECSKDTISFESQHTALWIFANLACQKENSMRLISSNRGLLHSLMRVASDPGTIFRRSTRSVWSHSYQALQVQRTALRCIVNLSFAEGIADQVITDGDALLSSLCQLLTLPTAPFGESQRVREIIVQIKRYSVGILLNISGTRDDNKRLLFQFQSGLIMRTCRDAANDSGDAVIQRAATQTLANLVIINRTVARQSS